MIITIFLRKRTNLIEFGKRLQNKTSAMMQRNTFVNFPCTTVCKHKVVRTDFQNCSTLLYRRKVCCCARVTVRGTQSLNSCVPSNGEKLRSLMDSGDSRAWQKERTTVSVDNATRPGVGLLLVVEPCHNLQVKWFPGFPSFMHILQNNFHIKISQPYKHMVIRRS